MSGVVAWVRANRDEGLGVVQVKLAPNGFRQGNRRGGSFPFKANDSAKLVSWAKAKHVEVKMLDGDRAEVFLASTSPSLKLRHVYVHANVACTADEAAALRQRLTEWLGALSLPTWVKLR